MRHRAWASSRGGEGDLDIGPLAYCWTEGAVGSMKSEKREGFLLGRPGEEDETGISEVRPYSGCAPGGKGTSLTGSLVCS